MFTPCLLQVTPKLGGLNPNATVFILQKTSTPQAEGQSVDPGPSGDAGQWENDSGVGMSTTSGTSLGLDEKFHGA